MNAIPLAVREQAKAMANATQVTHYIVGNEGGWLITPYPQLESLVILPRTPQRRYGVLLGY